MSAVRLKGIENNKKGELPGPTHLLIFQVRILWSCVLVIREVMRTSWVSIAFLWLSRIVPGRPDKIKILSTSGKFGK